ncbi:MAG: class I SAM-dependent RNA methyltransferase [Pseudomonadota bacterium]
MRTRRPPKKKSRKSVPLQESTLTVEGVTPSGDGQVGNLIIPFALPGEEVKVALRGQRADILERHNDAANRHEGVCRHFGLPGDGCGGCTLQHWGEEAARDLKRARLLFQLRKIDPEAELSAVHTSPPLSRRRAKFAVTAEGVGFRQLAGGRVVNLRECDILHPDLMPLTRPLATLARDLRGEFPSSFEAHAALTETGIDLALSGVNEQDLSFNARERLSAFADEYDLARLSADGVTAAERRTPRVTLGGVPVALPTGAFLQATEAGEAALLAEVLAAAEGSESAADLFCGVGTFALPLSSERRVLAVEGDQAAVSALSTAAKAAGREIRASQRDLFARPLQADGLRGVDFAVFDPPRAGALEQARELARAAVPTIVAVSCNPATLARDAAAFVSDYDLIRAVMVDQFGWSPHIETVAVFRRRT